MEYVVPSAPIVPNVGLGGLVLRTHIRDLQDMLFSYFQKSLGRESNANWYYFSYLFEPTYYIRPVKIVFDIRNGKLLRLTAVEGYTGSLLDSLYVGMKIRDAMKINESIYYDEAEELIFLRDTPGVSIYPSIDDVDIEQLPDCHITSISVYAHEALHTIEGDRGSW